MDFSPFAIKRFRTKHPSLNLKTLMIEENFKFIFIIK